MIRRLFTFFAVLATFHEVSTMHAHGDNVFADMKNNTVLELNYNIYSSGFLVASQLLSLNKINDKIHIHSKTETSNTVSWLQNSAIVIEVIETILPEKNTPITFRTNIVSETFLLAKKSASFINYEKDNKITYGYVPISNISEGDIPLELEYKYIKNTTNWLSMISNIMNFYHNNPQSCEFEERIFDVGAGTNIKFRSPRILNITSSDFTSYRGKALQCSVVFTPFPSRKKTAQPQSIGNIVIGKIADRFHLPVRFFVASSQPKIIMHLADYQLREITEFVPLNLLSDIPIPTTP